MNDQKFKEAIDEYVNQRYWQLLSKWNLSWLMFLLPALIFISMLTLTNNTPISGVFTFFSFIFLCTLYLYSRNIKLDDEKQKLKKTLLEKFMIDNYPDVGYRFYKGTRNAGAMIKRRKLFLFNKVHEEDVLNLNINDQKIYISQVSLDYRSDLTSNNAFQGTMISLQLDRKVPDGIIVHTDNKRERFYPRYKLGQTDLVVISEQPEAFNEVFLKYATFLNHLSKKHKDLIVSVKDNRIIVLIDSKEDFLDEPKDNLQRTWDISDYKQTFARQLNSCIYIANMFAGENDALNLYEKVERKILKEIKR